MGCNQKRQALTVFRWSNDRRERMMCQPFDVNIYFFEPSLRIDSFGARRSLLQNNGFMSRVDNTL